MKKNIAVVFGGNSSEYIVSVESGQNIFQSIDQELFVPWLVEINHQKWEVKTGSGVTVPIDKSDFSFRDNNKKIRFDYAYITIHGTPGEDGILQGYFDLIGMPYSSCGIHSSSLTFNKFYCSNYLRNFGIPMAQSLRVRKGIPVKAEVIVKQLGLPLFVKPSEGGSSFGITKVKEQHFLEEAVERAWGESGEALIEQFIEGKEYTCGVLKVGGAIHLFPITEIIPQNEFFDFEAKYTSGKTEEITPARLSPELTDCCQQLASKIYDLCDCRGIVRIDFIRKEDKFYFLEVNTTPGMTGTSFIPQQIKAYGHTLTEMLTLIIANGLN